MSKLALALALTTVCMFALGCGDSTVAPTTDGGPRDLGGDTGSPADLGGIGDGGMLVDANTLVDGGMLGDGGAIAVWEQFCTVDGPARSTRCGDTSTPVAMCRTDAACLIAVARPDVAAAIPACLSGRACGMSDDACYTAAGAGITPSAAATSFQTACLTKHTACGAGPSFPDDRCFVDILADAVMGELVTCLDSACAATGDCLTGVLNARAPGCF